MEIEKLVNIEITDEDILWVEEMMGGKVHFDSARVNVLKIWILLIYRRFREAVKQLYWLLSWQFLQRNGHIQCWHLCFIAYKCGKRRDRRAIRKHRDWAKIVIVSAFYRYSAFFFDTYVSLPWLKSNGYEINIIDTELVHSLRWNKLPRNKRYYLEMQYKSETICEYRDNIGNIERVKNEETNELLLSVIEKTQKDGYFTFGEMLLYAQKF